MAEFVLAAGGPARIVGVGRCRPARACGWPRQLSDDTVRPGRFTEGSADFEAAITENGGFWRPLTAAEYEGQGLTDEQTERIVAGSTPHPGATLTEPAALESSISELPRTCIKCLLDWPEPTETIARLLSSERWRLVTMDTGRCSLSLGN